jgi:hypothetical protein
MFRVSAILLILAALSSGARPDPAQTPTLDQLLQRAGAYTAAYEERFAAVVTDEQYEQKWFDRATPIPRRARKMSSEMMFLWLTNEKSWLSVRNVLAVDGRNVNDSQQRLDRLFASDAAIGVAKLRKMRDEGARFNIGTIRRNFNDPMFPMQFLEPPNQRRFTFTLTGNENVGGVATSKIAFEEHASPTFIQDGRSDLPSHGDVCVAADGSVMRTRLRILNADRHISAFVTIDYRNEASLEMPVPVKMQEIYTAGAPYERISGVATYSNFRRFETSARIVPDR